MKSGLRSAEGPIEGEPKVAEPRPPKPHERVGELLALARDDAQACKELIDALMAMRAPGDEAEEARVVLATLDEKRLDNLRDITGRDAKSEAVETLLSLGFPHALSVSPEDLAYLRGAEPGALGEVMWRIRKTRTRMLMAAVAGEALALSGAVSALATHRAGSEAAMGWAALIAAVTVGAAGWLYAMPPRLEQQSLPVTAIIMGGVATAVLAVSIGWLPLIGAGVLSLGLFSLLSWQSNE